MVPLGSPNRVQVLGLCSSCEIISLFIELADQLLSKNCGKSLLARLIWTYELEPVET